MIDQKFGSKLQAFKEAREYLKQIIFRPPLPPNRFIIFGRGRSGSTLLVDLLNSNDRIHCDGEILHHKVLSPHSHIIQHASRHIDKVYGFKLLSYQVHNVQSVHRPERFVENLYEKGFKIIYLRRRNLLRHAVSNINARSRKFHHQKDEDNFESKAIYIPPNDLSDWIAGSEKLESLEKKMLLKVPYLDLFYEDDLVDPTRHQATVDKVCHFLNVPTSEAKTKYVKLLPGNLSDIVENYSEIMSFLKNSRFSRYIDME